MLSETGPGHMPVITEEVTRDGAIEEWAFPERTYYFKDGRLDRWVTSVKDAAGHMRGSPRDR